MIWISGSEDQHGLRRDQHGVAQIPERRNRAAGKFRPGRGNRLGRNFLGNRKWRRRKRKFDETSAENSRRQGERLPCHAVLEGRRKARVGREAARRELGDVVVVVDSPPERLRERASRQRLRDDERARRPIVARRRHVEDVAELAASLEKHRLQCQKVFQKLLRRVDHVVVVVVRRRRHVVAQRRKQRHQNRRLDRTQLRLRDPDGIGRHRHRLGPAGG